MRLVMNFIAAICLPLVVVACGDDITSGDADPFDTLQLCFDEHHGTEGLGTKESIVVCCLDHPIGPAREHPSCGTTEAACEAHVNAELSDTSVSTSEITVACTDYVAQMSM